MRSWVVLLLLLPVSALADEGVNLATNPGFEEVAAGGSDQPAGWNYFTSKGQAASLTTNLTHSGERALRVISQQEAGSNMGLLQSLAVEGSKHYRFSAFVRNDKEQRIGGGFRGQLSIEWLDGDGAEVSRVSGGTWQRDLSYLRWEPVRLDAQAPAKATQGKFVISLTDDGRPGEGVAYVDDVTIEIR